MDPERINTPPKNNKVTLSFDLRVVVILLLVVIAAMIFVWQPWVSKADAKSRTITVTGEATVKAEPDEFVFSPSYEFKNKDKKTALNELTQKSQDITEGLKKLGVSDRKIKVDSSGYNYDYYYDSEKQQNTYSLRMTVTTDNKDLTQKVQDYLVKSEPTGNISPQATFSKKLEKKLDDQARDKAIDDSRIKADKMASRLQFSLGKIKTVDESNETPSYYMKRTYSDIGLSTGDSAANLPVQAGEDDLTYSVRVVYYINN